MQRLAVGKFLCLWLFVVISTSLVWSQATTSLGGRVTDSGGAVIPGASVKLTMTATGAVRSATTNSTGEYHFSQLAPGDYRLLVTATGFATAERTGVELLVSQPATLNVELPVAAVTSKVTVTSSAPILNTTDATLGNAIDAKQIESLPSEARNVPDLLSLQPGVTFLGRTDADTGTQANGNTSDDSRSGAVNGGRSDQSNITLDGISVNDINNGYAFTSVLRVPQDAIAEFRVTTSNPNAAEGRSSGAQVALVTKSGSNELHGVVYEYNRNNLFHANDFFNKQTEAAQNQPNTPLKLIRNVFGADAGGPILKDKAFFFLGYEGRRDTQGSSSNGNKVPMADFRNGNLTYACDPSPNCPGGTYTLTPEDLKHMDPQGIGIDAAAQAYMGQYPEPNNPTVGDGLNFEGYSFPYTVQRSYDTYVARLDWNITKDGKNVLFWRGNLQDDHEPGGPQFPGQPANTTSLNNSKGFAAGYTHLFTPNLINSLDFGLTREGLASKGLLSGPYSTLQGLTSLESHSATRSMITPVYSLVDNLSWTRGKHNLQFGEDIRFISNQSASNALSYSYANGTYQYLNPANIAGGGGTFDPAAYGYPAVSNPYRGNYNTALMAMIGIINVGNITYNSTKDGGTLPVGALVKRNYRWNEYGFYAQDSWRILSNLTLTYGLRYEYLEVPAETTGTQVGICRVSDGACENGSFSLSGFVDQRATLAAAGQSTMGAGELGFPLNGRYNGKPDYWTPGKSNFAPRVAFAYTPNPSSGFGRMLFGSGRTSIRGGYGLLFDHFGAAITNQFSDDGSFGLSTSLQTSAGVLKIGDAPRFTGPGDVPQSLLPPPPVIGFPGIPVASGPTSGAIYWSEDSAVKTPYSHAVNFTIERQVKNGSSIQVSYVGRFAHHLLEQEDVAMPANLVSSGGSYFQAAKQLSLMARANTSVDAVQPDPYWQTLFGALDGQDIGFGPGYTATQNIYLLYQENLYNEANALYALDMSDDATDAGINTNGLYPSNRYFQNQFSALYAWRSIGNSSFHGLEAVYRQRFGLGLQADFNYTLAKSMDDTSMAERRGTSGGINYAQIINTWDPHQLYGVSDFDIRQQINGNYVWQLPFGRGKEFASNIGRLADEAIGGWQFTGIVRWTSGLPFGVSNSSNYPTNYDIDGFATQRGKIPSGRGQLNQTFKNPAAVLAAFDFALPGESGSRNPLRGDGYFDWDAGLGKTFSITERLNVKTGMEIFNVTNSVRFDVNSISAGVGDPNSFGFATDTLTNPRLAQFYARMSF